MNFFPNIRILYIILIFVFLYGCSNSEKLVLNNEINKQKIFNNLKKIKDKGSTFNKIIKPELQHNIKQFIEKTIPGSEISILSSENQKPEIQITKIEELYNSNELRNTFFWQGSILHHDGGNRNTLNLGLGYRNLSKNKQWLNGINLFYDEEFPYNHRRTSVGLEIKNYVFEITSNRYWNLTNWKTGKNNKKEKALGGYDLDLGIQIPYFPSAKLHAQIFNWKTKNISSDNNGEKIYFNFNSPFKKGWNVQTGYKYNRIGPNTGFFNINYNWQFGKKDEIKTNSFFSKEPFVVKDMTNRRLEKVRRENKIIKATSGFTLSFR